MGASTLEKSPQLPWPFRKLFGQGGREDCAWDLPSLLKQACMVSGVIQVYRVVLLLLFDDGGGLSGFRACHGGVGLFTSHTFFLATKMAYFRKTQIP